MISAELRQIIEDLKANKETFTELDLSNDDIYDEGNNYIDAEGARALADALKVNKHLTTLDLDHNEIDAEGARALADALKENKNLTTLCLSYNYIGAEGAMALADALKVNKHLTTLVLAPSDSPGGNEIGAEGAMALADALKVNKHLTTLELEENQIGAEGAMALADALKVNKDLTTLGLEHNHIGADGARALADALKENKHLTELYLGNDEFGDTALQQEIDALLERNQTIAKTINNFKITLKEAREILSQVSLDGFDEKINQAQEHLSFLEDYPQIHDEYDEYKKDFDVLVIDAYIAAKNYIGAFAYYAKNPTISDIAAYQLAHFIYYVGESSFQFKSSKERAAATLALLKKSFLFEQTQGLIPEVVLRLFNKENSDSEKISTEQILGVDKVVPLSFLEETLIGCFEKEEVLEEALANWMTIRKDLHQLSPLQLYSVCQLTPLSKALEESSIGTASITTFEGLLRYQNEYPLKPQESETLQEIVRKITSDPYHLALNEVLEQAVKAEQQDNEAESAASQAGTVANLGLFSGNNSHKRRPPVGDSPSELDGQPPVKKGRIGPGRA